jgi:hypothetical protein
MALVANSRLIEKLGWAFQNALNFIYFDKNKKFNNIY